MDEINLCIDIGNTRTKAALYADNKELAYVADCDIATFNQWKDRYKPRILVSASGKNEQLQAELKPEDYLSHTTPIPIHLNYKTPKTLGRDRIAAAVGAYSINPKATWMIIDLGTCLTIDLLHEGSFEGGLIAPGIEMRFKAMNAFTAGLPLVQYNPEISFPGKSTEGSLQVGVGSSIVYEIQGYIGQLKALFPALKIVDCSGYPINFDKEGKNEIFARPKLVLEGLNTIINQFRNA
jgi:type III pantothenate kinase